MNKPLLELYGDSLMSSFAQITATGLARVLDDEFSHDQITRFLAEADYTSCDLWLLVKPVVRAISDKHLYLLHSWPASKRNLRRGRRFCGKARAYNTGLWPTGPGPTPPAIPMKLP